METGVFSWGGRRFGSAATLVLLGFVAWGCAGSSSGVRPETSTPALTRIQGPGAGYDVHLTTELSKGVFHLNAPPDEVWAAMPAVYEELGIEINLRDPTARVVGNNNFRPRRIDGARNSRYLDCGYGSTAVPHADGYDVTASLIATVRSGDESGTLLETLFTGSARAREVSGGNVSCSSKGTLERRMVEILSSLVGADPSGGQRFE